MNRLMRAIGLAILAVAIAVPMAAQAKGNNGTKVLPGQSAVIWSNPNATSNDEPATIIVSAVSGVSPMSAGSTTAGCEYKGVNLLGWTLWRYTLYQYFSYSGTSITYYPTPTFTTEGNWGWYDNGSSAPTKHWISNPSSAYSIGYYAFRHDVGDLHESRNGWVRADIRGTGSWWCSAA